MTSGSQPPWPVPHGSATMTSPGPASTPLSPIALLLLVVPESVPPTPPSPTEPPCPLCPLPSPASGTAWPGGGLFSGFIFTTVGVSKDVGLVPIGRHVPSGAQTWQAS